VSNPSSSSSDSYSSSICLLPFSLYHPKPNALFGVKGMLRPTFSGYQQFTVM